MGFYRTLCNATLPKIVKLNGDRLMFESKKVPPSPCFSCKRVNNMAGTIQDKEPSPGDIGICFYCRSINIYDENKLLREPTDEELRLIHPDELRQIRLYTDAIAEIQQKKDNDKRI